MLEKVKLDTHQMCNWCNQNSNYAIWIYKLANSISSFIFLFSQFINPNSVIRILVTPVTHLVRIKFNFLQHYFLFIFDSIYLNNGFPSRVEPATFVSKTLQDPFCL